MCFALKQYTYRDLGGFLGSQDTLNCGTGGHVKFWARLLNRGVSTNKQGSSTFAWRPGSQCDIAATRGADSVPGSDFRAPIWSSFKRMSNLCDSMVAGPTARTDNVLPENYGTGAH